MKRLCLLILTISLMSGPGFAVAEIGVTDKAVVFGSSTNLTGPSPIRATDIKRGYEAYFKKINAAGGVHGRKIEMNP